MSKPVEIFIYFYLSQTEDVPRGKISKDRRKMLLRTAVYRFFYAFGIKKQTLGRLHEGAIKQEKDWVSG